MGDREKGGVEAAPRCLIPRWNTQEQEAMGLAEVEGMKNREARKIHILWDK